MQPVSMCMQHSLDLAEATGCQKRLKRSKVASRGESLRVTVTKAALRAWFFVKNLGEGLVANHGLGGLAQRRPPAISPSRVWASGRSGRPHSGSAWLGVGRMTGGRCPHSKAIANPGATGIGFWWICCASRVIEKSFRLSIILLILAAAAPPPAGAESRDGVGSYATGSTRTAFESSTPEGYTEVSLSDSGDVWGVPASFTNDSDPGTVAYMLLGMNRGCDFANAEVDRGSKVYVKAQSLGGLDDYKSEQACRKSSSEWLLSWPGLRMTNLLFFDESSPSNIYELVYDADNEVFWIVDRAAVVPVEFDEGKSATRSIPENTPFGINVGRPVSAVGDDSFQYTIGGADAEYFTVVSDTGQIRTRAGATYDYETRQRYEVTISAQGEAGNTGTIDVAIVLRDLLPNCESPSSLFASASNASLRLRWTPVPNKGGHARILGYQTEIRRGESGDWSDRRTLLGQHITGMIYGDLFNGIGYQVRIRPINAEVDCEWSVPISGVPKSSRAPGGPDDHFERFPGPVGSPDHHFRFLTPGRCRHTRNSLTLDADCEYSNTGPDTGRIFLEFDDSSKGSCEITLAYSSLTAGSFIDECFDAGVKTGVPFDESFRMPRLDTETEVPRAPRSQEEFDVLAWGRDDLIPGLGFGCPPAFETCEFNPGTGYRIGRDPDSGLPLWTLGEYTYENTGPSQGVLTFRADDGKNHRFTLNVEPSGRMQITISDPDGGVPEWPGMPDTALGPEAPTILLPIPPSWSAAIEIETDAAPEDWSGIEDQIPLPLESGSTYVSLEDVLQLGDTLSTANSETAVIGYSPDYRKIGRNRATLVVSWETIPGTPPRPCPSSRSNYLRAHGHMTLRSPPPESPNSHLRSGEMGPVRL